MELLRNKGQLTKVLILASIVIHKKATVVAIAEAVDITPQGVSEYVSTMEDEGLVMKERGGIRATISGVEHLQKALLTLKGFVDRSIEGLEIVRSTDAIAEGPIRKGEHVALFMKEGLLYAKCGEGASWGIADSDAGENDMVQISSLTGVLEMERSRIRLVTVPPARSGGGRCRLDPAKFHRHAERGHGIHYGSPIIAALDMESSAMLLRSSIHYDLQMPDAETLRGYHERGRPVIAFGTPHSIAVLEERLAQMRPDGCSERNEGIAPV
jgi:predicted transcriptional regulator